MRLFISLYRVFGWVLGLAIYGSLITGCATVGKEFPASRVMEIQNGKTTINDIQAIFGPPWRVGNENGLKTWSYGRYTYRLIGDPSTQDLIVRFDSNGIVKSFNYNTTTNK